MRRVRHGPGTIGSGDGDPRWFVGQSCYSLWRFHAASTGHGPRIRPAQKFEPDSSGQAEKLLINAANLAEDRQWSEAINIYQRVIDQYGDKVVMLPKDAAGADASGDFALYVDQRRFCHAAIAHLPPEATKIYRNRIDAMAQRWFQQGASQRDFGLLRRVVDQAFCSSWGDDAVELLGDLAFQEGRFGESLAMYRRLVVDRPGENALVHPDPSVDWRGWPPRRCSAARPWEKTARQGRTGRLRPALPQRDGALSRPQGHL